MRLLALFLLAVGLRGTVHGQRVGLVLSGGGATGLAHIGVLKALEENGIPIDYITGSSMGALIGGMYAAGYSPWEMDSLFRTELYQLMAEGGIEDRFVYRFMEDCPDASVFGLKLSTDTTLQTSLPTSLRNPVLMDLEQMIGLAGASAASGYDMDSLFVPFRCMASDITARRPVMYRKGDLALAIRASMSYPFYFQPIKVDDHLMMDGGLYNNFPSDVMYQEFIPDVILGSNVSTKSPPPSEDDLMSQLRAMVQQETNYSVVCEEHVIIEPQTPIGTFDFRDPERAIEDGYKAALALMPRIKEGITRHVHRAELNAARTRFRSRMPRVVFGTIEVEGLNKGGRAYALNVLRGQNGQQSAKVFRPHYFRLFADHNVAQLQPRAHYSKERGDFDLSVRVKREKNLELRVGGLLSSRPINTGMLTLRYNFLTRSSNRLEGLGYFGKFYAGGQAKLRSNFSGRLPVYFEPVLTIHRWDWFTGFTSFFDDVRPPFILQREQWGGMNLGIGLGHKGLARMDVKYAQTRDSYYQASNFTPVDTADVTEFFFVTTGLLIERNSLNRKQHPNAGECLRAELRYVNGEERTTPGSMLPKQGLTQDAQHEWLVAKVTLDKYFLSKGRVRFGVLAEGVYSTQEFFQNYTATLIRTPSFQPTPESRTLFIDALRAPQYMAGGLRGILSLARNRLDLRAEGYVFQPYKAIIRGPNDQAEEGTAISDRSWIASGSLLYESPIGPVWFNASYFSSLDDPWVVSINFGYVIFAQRTLE